MIDALSWESAAATYAGEAGAWQTYLTNHRVALVLGKKPAAGGSAGNPRSGHGPAAD